MIHTIVVTANLSDVSDKQDIIFCSSIFFNLLKVTSHATTVEYIWGVQICINTSSQVKPIHIVRIRYPVSILSE